MKSFVRRALKKILRIIRSRLLPFRSPVRAAIIGFGEIGPDHIESFESTGIAQVVAIADVRPEALANARRRWPSLRVFRCYQQMLKEVKPDVISICTWPDSHAEIACESINHGVRGILCEKPVALTLSEIDRMKTACLDDRVRIAVGHQYRFHGHFAAAAAAIEEGRLGKNLTVFGCIQGVLADNGPHLVDAVSMLLGDPKVKAVECECFREEEQFKQGMGVEEGASGLIVFTNGTRAKICTGNKAASFFSVRVEGEKGWVEISPSTFRTSFESLNKTAKPGDFRRNQFHGFCRWAQRRKAGYCSDLETGASSAEIVLALYEAARLGIPVNMPLQNQGDIIGNLYPRQQLKPFSSPKVPTVEQNGEHLAWDGGRASLKNWYDSSPEMGIKEVKNLSSVLYTKRLNCTEGPMVRRLETAFMREYQAPYAVASSSGTAAIHIALAALRLNPGDEVITTPLSDMGTVIPILACNCIPIFADVDPVTGNLTAKSIANKISARTRAVIVVHLAGRPADLDPICKIVENQGIFLIEDCAQAHFAEYRGKKVGTFGDFGCFSLQQLKHITCGDGGITIAKDAELAENAALFSDKGWRRSGGARNHLFLGMNYRMTELQAAVALAQLERLPQLIIRRRESARNLSEKLLEIDGVRPPTHPEDINPAWWLYLFSINEEHLNVSKNDFANALAVEGIRFIREYIPQPIFEYDVIKNRKTYGDSGYPLTEFGWEQPLLEDFPGFRNFNRQITLFWSHRIKDSHVESIAKAVDKVIRLLPKKQDLD